MLDVPSRCMVGLEQVVAHEQEAATKPARATESIRDRAELRQAQKHFTATNALRQLGRAHSLLVMHLTAKKGYEATTKSLHHNSR